MLSHAKMRTRGRTACTLYKQLQSTVLGTWMTEIVRTWKYRPLVGKMRMLYPSINSGKMPMESSNLASSFTSFAVKLYLKACSLCINLHHFEAYIKYLPTIFRESRVPIVMPKFRSLAFSKPGTTFLRAVSACIACSLPSISALVRSSTFVQSSLKEATEEKPL